MSFLNKICSKPIETGESSNFFFHFTPEIKHLISIMNDNFKPFYCMEDLSYLNMPELRMEGMAYPVVCFCDIPLSRQKEHRRKYGEYGIGMKKEWGIAEENHLTPIIYAHGKSITSANMKNMFLLSPTIQEKLSKEEFQKFNNSISTLIMHFKPYEGFRYCKKNKRFIKNLTRFYDEKEWRFIPLDCDGLKLNLEMEDYQNDKILAEENEKIQKGNRINFTFDDVEYIFLKERSETNDFLSKLSSKYSIKELDVLAKKIKVD